MDGSLSQSPVRSQKTAEEGLGSNPTDRGRTGTKIHLHVDQQGIPLGVVVVGANVHDSRLVGVTLEKNSDLVNAFVICTGEYSLCLDKGYDYERVREEVPLYGLEPHIRSRGEEKTERQEGSHPARRWVVERTFARLKGFRCIRTRYCCYLESFLAFVKLACAIIVFRKTPCTQIICRIDSYYNDLGGSLRCAKQLKEKGLIDANNEAAIVNECRGKQPAWEEQCRSACDHSTTTRSNRPVYMGWRLGCAACSNNLKDN